MPPPPAGFARGIFFACSTSRKPAKRLAKLPTLRRQLLFYITPTYKKALDLSWFFYLDAPLASSAVAAAGGDNATPYGRSRACVARELARGSATVKTGEGGIRCPPSVGG